MRKEFDTFIDSLADVVDDWEVKIFIRDLAPGRNKYAVKLVKA